MMKEDNHYLGSIFSSAILVASGVFVFTQPEFEFFLPSSKSKNFIPSLLTIL